jgi:hypothetical protein
MFGGFGKKMRPFVEKFLPCLFISSHILQNRFSGPERAKSCTTKIRYIPTP